MCFRPLRRQAIRELCMNDVNGRVLVVGAFRFPTGDAAAARVLGIAKSSSVAGSRDRDRSTIMAKEDLSTKDFRTCRRMNFDQGNFLR